MRRAILNEQWLNGYVVNSNLPIGAPMAWLSEVPPVGFLAFDGSEYNISDYPELYNVIKNIPSFHSDTEGKFKIPNLKGRVLQGADTVIGELIEAGLPNIKGRFRHTTTGGGGSEVDGAFSNFTISEVNANVGGKYKGNGVKFDASKGETKTDGTLKTEYEPHVYGNSDTVQPPAFTVRWVIKATNYVSLEKNAIDDTKTTNANVWSAQHTMDILGFEMGSNENGDYRKWANGVIEQWGSTTTIANAGKPINFPIPMKTIKFANVTGNSIFSSLGKSRGGYDELTTSGMTVAYIGGDNQTHLAGTVYWTVVGTWK